MVVATSERKRITEGERLERAREMGDRVQLLTQLAQEPGWALLRELFERREKEYYDGLARSLMRGNAVDETSLNYNRGLFDGVRQLLQAPDTAEAQFKKALKKANLLDEQTRKE